MNISEIEFTTPINPNIGKNHCFVKTESENFSLFLQLVLDINSIEEFTPNFDEITDSSIVAENNSWVKIITDDGKVFYAQLIYIIQ